MDDDTRDGLEFARRVARGFAAIRDVLGEATTARRQGSGADRTGCVLVVAGADGVPESIELGPRWRQVVGAEGLAAAVTEACENATRGQWETLAKETDSVRWETDLERLMDRTGPLLAYLNEGPPPPGLVADLPTTPTGATPPSVATPPDGGAVGGDGAVVQTMVEEVIRRASEPPVGSAALGRVTVTFEPTGAVRCEADPEWTSRESDEQVVAALRTALLSARSERDDAEAAAARLLGPRPAGDWAPDASGTEW